MTQTENEKELILGNKQLITLFFLVVAMCGAFFAFGYIIGRNGAKPAPAVADASAVTGNTASPTPTPETPAATPPSDSAEPAAGDAQPGDTETQPAHDVPSSTTPFSSQAPSRVATTQIAATQVATTAPSAPQPAVPASAKTAAPPVASAALEPGATYLQVTALRKSDADNLVKTLRELKLPAFTAESSKSDLMRVLVGPYHQMTQVAEVKAKLKSLGFANSFVQKQ